MPESAVTRSGAAPPPPAAALEVLPELDAEGARLRRYDVDLTVGARVALRVTRELGPAVHEVADEEIRVHAARAVGSELQIDQRVSRHIADDGILIHAQHGRCLRLVHTRYLSVWLPTTHRPQGITDDHVPLELRGDRQVGSCRCGGERRLGVAGLVPSEAAVVTLGQNRIQE